MKCVEETTVIKEVQEKGVTTFSLDVSEEDAVPAWIKAVQATADAMD